MHVLHAQSQQFIRKVPEIRPGYTVRVHERIQEGSKERVQVFEGLVISVHKGHVPTDASFTVRRVVSGIGVEKVFPLHVPTIEKIEVKKVAKVRRAKLFFIRGRSGKAARLTERFTNEGEFAIKDDEPMVPESGTAEELTDENIVPEEVKTEEPETASAPSASASSESEEVKKEDEQKSA